VQLAGIGFSVLLARTRALGLDPLSGRAVSFTAAVMTTFELNRNWSFRCAPQQRYLAALTRYLGAQGLGGIVNFFMYSFLYIARSRPLGSPLFYLCIAATIALLVNYIGGRIGSSTTATGNSIEWITRSPTTPVRCRPPLR
jgi:putative flippase GtrA